jgi:N utilization substance protein B
MLFQYDLARQPVDELVQTYWGELAEAADEVRDFANDLVTGVISHLDEIDERIRLRTEHWRIPRMAVVDRNLLRLAVYEFVYQPHTPKTVAINEALEIARRFSTHEATQFVNGILDAIKRDMEEKAPPPPAKADGTKEAATTSTAISP